jgi:hypothetical protein
VGSPHYADRAGPLAWDSQHPAAVKNASIALTSHVVEPMTESIAATLTEAPLCEQIALFLLENETAMDTARGIAAWWVGCDEVAVQAALDRLIACGVVTPYTFTSGILYGLTRNEEVRVWLRTTYGAGARRIRRSAGDGEGMAAS